MIKQLYKYVNVYMNTQINSSVFVRVGDEICTVNQVFFKTKNIQL